MAKVESWIEVYNPETGTFDKFRDPLNPDAFPEEGNEQQKEGAEKPN